MVLKLIPLISLVAAASGVVVPVHLATAAHVYLRPAPIHSELNEEAPAHYEFEYSVSDPASGDVKQQKETRNGDAVEGVYSFLQPDGFQRIVEYSSSKDDGFHAQVRYESQKVKPVAKVHKLAPLKYVLSPGLHAPVSAKLTYAPTAEVANIHVIPSKILYPQSPYIAEASQGQIPLHVSFATHPATQVGYSQGPQVTYTPVIFGRPLTQVIYTQPPSKVSYSGAPQFPYQNSSPSNSQIPTTQGSQQFPYLDKTSQETYSQVPTTQGSEQFLYQDTSQITNSQIPTTQGSQQFPYQDTTSKVIYSQVPTTQGSEQFPYQDSSQVTYSQMPATQVPYQLPYYTPEAQLGRISNTPRRRVMNHQLRH